MSELVQPESGGTLYITSPFGPRNVTGGSRNHRGTDLGGTSTTVRAIADGVVVASRYSSSAGWLVDIDHGKDSNGKRYKSRNFHLRRQGIKKGSRVHAGEAIGEEGSTGNSIAAHLHLEVHENGKPIDPEKFFRAHGATLGKIGSEGVFPLREYKLGERSLKKGTSGPDVETWQGVTNAVLERAGSSLARLKKDGDFGPKTDGGTREVQRIVGVKVTGIVTTDLIDAVAAYMAVPVIDIPKTPGGLTTGVWAPPLASGTTNTTGGPGKPVPSPTKGATMEATASAIVSRGAALWFSLVRTLVPVLVGSIIGWFVDQNITVPEEISESVTLILVAAGIAVWYLIGRLAETYGPPFIQRLGGYMLGVARPAAYVESNANSEVQARAPPATS